MFSEQAIDLLTLSCALDPKEEYKSLNIDDICTYAKRLNLKFHLRYFEYDMHNDVKLQNLSSLSQLCIVLRET